MSPTSTISSASSPDAIHIIARSVKDQIDRFEPRLASVSVRHVVDPDNPLNLVFEIHAALVVDGTHGRVTFETVLGDDGFHAGEELTGEELRACLGIGGGRDGVPASRMQGGAATAMPRIAEPFRRRRRPPETPPFGARNSTARGVGALADAPGIGCGHLLTDRPNCSRHDRLQFPNRL